MGLQKQVIEQMKVAMKAKDTVALTALRALKSAFMIANTQTGTATEISEEEALKIIQKQVKQRKDSAAVFTEQKRDDLAKPELEEATVLEQFLPEALSEEEIAKVVAEVIAKTNATGMKDMGKVMGMVSKQLAGVADGATISAIVKKTLA
ncbi:GatB/YqeY domain-containing protein [Tenacibaculum finnmarkense genomovar finnmarkense]|uniref:GatB/YqeY domain-containing protein n=1 Tax=Tenacibaculum finnmarkense TaxID=2781243 RepID=UPI000C63101D|nr:GatB/YqeY domain-containing protein [Tenacibaculum finnmarkense]MCD8410206.1 GatB/YqeY domain-containing protein [Tenacibaculum finnmarkense genomovar ulcerans]MCD8412302.1 GatB/YqeY domain-containing protein [Tenacibaculum finnmarkense genomovar ulcerans]MCD8416593.1 GatB/YqeY domain-containing protein [Tenacibaculum finnmarkense genomovar finnmarkense]MCD8440068.1 GatB/YqeY domain-containing protein [Tenacibaculum finnmarkense genomovar ulcerans]MCD8447418.1 GatB/YqeY domain-containing pr